MVPFIVHHHHRHLKFAYFFHICNIYFCSLKYTVSYEYFNLNFILILLLLLNGNDEKGRPTNIMAANSAHFLHLMPLLNLYIAVYRISRWWEFYKTTIKSAKSVSSAHLRIYSYSTQLNVWYLFFFNNLMHSFFILYSLYVLYGPLWGICLSWKLIFFLFFPLSIGNKLFIFFIKFNIASCITF